MSAATRWVMADTKTKYQRYKNPDEITLRFYITRELDERIERYRAMYEKRDGTRVLRSKAAAMMLASLPDVGPEQQPVKR